MIGGAPIRAAMPPRSCAVIAAPGAGEAGGDRPVAPRRAPPTPPGLGRSSPAVGSPAPPARDLPSPGRVRGVMIAPDCRLIVATESGSKQNTGENSKFSGNLPGGSQFAGASGLRQALLSRPDMFIGTISEKLLTYALGRGLEYYDTAAVRKIIRDARSSDYKFSSLIAGTVNSAPFQMRRSQ